MEKTITWEPNEATMMQGIEQKRMQVLAQIGALMMDLENAKKVLETVNEEHKSAIRTALSTRGITQFESARPFQGGIILNISETRANGGA